METEFKKCSRGASLYGTKVCDNSDPSRGGHATSIDSAFFTLLKRYMPASTGAHCIKCTSQRGVVVDSRAASWWRSQATERRDLS